MKCPRCSQKMLLKKKDFSYDLRAKTKKKYVRKIYWCKEDDVWMTVEAPLRS